MKLPDRIKELRPAHRRILAALVQCGTIARAAASLNLTQQHLSNTLQDYPQVRELWEEAVLLSVEDAMIELATGAQRAVDMLLQSLDPASHRKLTPTDIKIAGMVIQHAENVLQRRRLVKEVDELRARLDAYTNQSGVDPTRGDEAPRDPGGVSDEPDQAAEETGDLPVAEHTD